LSCDVFVLEVMIDRGGDGVEVKVCLGPYISNRLPIQIESSYDDIVFAGIFSSTDDG
jgi:hypothetical protein